MKRDGDKRVRERRDKVAGGSLLFLKAYTNMLLYQQEKTMLTKPSNA